MRVKKNKDKKMKLKILRLREKKWRQNVKEWN